VEAPTKLMRLIGYCGHLGRQCMDQNLRQCEYPATPVQSHTLQYLARVEGKKQVTQRDLEQELGLKASTVNGIVMRLEEKGYILRRPSDTDGRCRLVLLTDTGRQLVRNFRAVAETTDRAAFDGLSDREREQLRGLLERVISNLENEVNNT